MRKSLNLKLSTKDIARIALLFLDGDAFENVIPERWREFKNFDDLDYNEQEFNQLKVALMKTEQLRRGIAAVLWRRRPDDASKGEIVVAASTSSTWAPGRGIIPLPARLIRCFEKGDWVTIFHRKKGTRSYYAPLRNSDDEIVGALELYENPARVSHPWNLSP